MAKFILHNKGRYNIYSTISDNFIFESSLNLGQLKEWSDKEYGLNGQNNFEDRMYRVHDKGTSSYDDENLEETLIANRCGENESCLTYQECIYKFLS